MSPAPERMYLQTYEVLNGSGSVERQKADYIAGNPASNVQIRQRLALQQEASGSAWVKPSASRTSSSNSALESSVRKEHRHMAIRGMGILLLEPGSLHHSQNPGHEPPKRGRKVAQIPQEKFAQRGRIHVSSKANRRRPLSAGYHSYRIDAGAPAALTRNKETPETQQLQLGSMCRGTSAQQRDRPSTATCRGRTSRPLVAILTGTMTSHARPQSAPTRRSSSTLSTRSRYTMLNTPAVEENSANQMDSKLLMNHRGRAEVLPGGFLVRR